MNGHIDDTMKTSGFTLIELSIALVIIGLLVGGILAGRDLIDAAQQRAQVSQIEKYNTAVNTFRLKYGYLPGDIPDPAASSFGFHPRGPYAGQGDGNGVIEGNCANSASGNNGFNEGCGEQAIFWVDVSTAGFLDAQIIYGGSGYPALTYTTGVTLASTPGVAQWLPPAKTGQGNFVYLWSQNGANYFAVSTVTAIGWSIDSSANPGLTVQQAYNIDRKTDDGLPQSGSITACYVRVSLNYLNPVAPAGNGLTGAGGNCTATTVATPYSPTNCYDNNGVAGTQTYSLAQNANVQNCALSFKFQ